jgi:hypothetical protein
MTFARWALLLMVTVGGWLSSAKADTSDVLIRFWIQGSYEQMASLGQHPLRIERFEKAKYQLVNTSVFEAGAAESTVKVDRPTFFRATHHDFPDIILLVVPTERQISVVASVEELRRAEFMVTGSKENKCLAEVRKAESELGGWYFRIMPQARSGASEVLDSLLYTAQRTFNKKMNDISAAFPSCFCSEFVIGNLKAPVRTDRSRSIAEFFATHALDSIDWSNQQLMRFPHFFGMMSAYRRNFLSDRDEDQRLFIETVFGIDRMAIELRTYLFQYYLQYYVANAKLDLAKRLSERNTNVKIDGNSPDGEVTLSIMRMLNGERFTLPLLPDKDNMKQDAMSFLANGETGIVLFYDHDCESCQEAYADLQSLLGSSTKSIKVVAVGLNADQDRWRSFVSTANGSFLDLFLPPDLAPHVSKQHAILSIPTIIVVDRAFNVIHRATESKSLSEFIGK